MWPPIWGFKFWQLLHDGALWYKRTYGPKKMEDGLLQTLRLFVVRLCAALPCGDCSRHCHLYVGGHVPSFSTGDEFWAYLVDFHNTVNKRLEKMEVTHQAALEMTEARVPADPTEAFKKQYWDVVVWIEQHHHAVHNYLTKEKKDEKLLPDIEPVLRGLCHLFPFGHLVINEKEGTTVRDQMLKFMDENKAGQINMDSPFAWTADWFNSIADHFPNATLTTAHLLQKRHFEKAHGPEYVEISRAYQIREEDHKMMRQMQEELTAARTGNKGADSVSPAYKSATIALAAVLGSILFCILGLYIVYRFRIGGHWALVRLKGRKATVARQRDAS